MYVVTFSSIVTTYIVFLYIPHSTLKIIRNSSLSCKLRQAKLFFTINILTKFKYFRIFKKEIVVGYCVMSKSQLLNTVTIHLSLAGVLFLLLTSGCSRQYVITDRGPQAYYQTGYPVQDTSRELERIFQSIKRINVTGHYNTFIFYPDRRITLSDLEGKNLLELSDENLSFSDSKAGTATILSSSLTQTALITNEHVISYPDTVIEYYKFEDGNRSPYIEQISIKTHQLNLIYDLPELGAFEVIAKDPSRDLAVIGVYHGDDELSRFPRVLRTPAGNPEKLSWGSFVYVLGYPKGYKMVTRGIVSDPNRDQRASFNLDALFNKGISGGIIVAIRGETGEMEWVGMARAGSATTEMILVPRDISMEDADLFRPYEGDIFLKPDRRIDYGLTLSVSMKSIQSFLTEHRNLLEQKGYSISRFLRN